MKSKFNFKNILCVIIFLVALSFIFVELNQKDIIRSGQPLPEIKTVSIGQRQFSVILADTIMAQIKGLGGRDSIKSDEVMLFDFEGSGRHAIWMKDMKFPIDILWLDKGQIVVDIKREVSPTTYPEIFTPSSDAFYVLEAESGFAQKNNVKIGTKISFLN